MHSRRLTLLLIAALFVSPFLRGHRRFPSIARCPSIRAAVVIIHAPISMPRGTRHFPVSPTSACIQLKSKIVEIASLVSGQSLPRRMRLPERREDLMSQLTEPPPHLASRPLRC